MNKKYILLVEDNPDDTELVLRSLDKNRIANEVVVARDGVEALDFLFGTGSYTGRDINNVPTVILLDLKLPKIDGFEVLQRIRSNEKTKYLPVVILTSSREDSDLIKGYEMGTNSYVRKPVDFLQFAEAIRNLGLFWILTNETPPCPK